VGRIIVLDEVTAARIAAGEVVERPASVVKELVENALDARAGRIEIELGDGGLDFIRVADDGEGMDGRDAVLAFERHATSKLERPEDLGRIDTYGFRGEALPSIGAVARVRLLTCPAGADEGTEIVYEGGRLVGARPGAARKGTVVWVRDLFFNTPARRQALRSAAAEAARVSEVAGTLALARPDVAVSLWADGRLLWSTPGGGDLEETTAALFGSSFLRGMTPVEGPAGPVCVRGLAGLPAQARRDGRRQYLFCNRRPIAARILRAAFEDAYRGLLGTGLTPVFIIELETAPSDVDVNIHPAKVFVRFRDHGSVHRAVVSAVRSALARRDLFPGRLAGLPAPVGDGGDPASRAARAAGTGEAATAEGPVGFGAGAARGGLFGGGDADGWGRREGCPGTEPPGSRVPFDLLEPIGQLAGLFVLAEGPDGLYILDQHAADERVTFEALLARDGRDGSDAGEGCPVQPLAVPETVELGPGDEAALERCLGPLAALGFDIEPFGPRAVLVRAVPAALAEVPPGALVRDYLERTMRPGRSPDPRQAALVMAACKSALRAGCRLSRDDMRRLVSSLARTSEPRTCPHGRPTILRLSLGELRRAFGRSGDRGEGRGKDREDRD